MGLFRGIESGLGVNSPLSQETNCVVFIGHTQLPSRAVNGLTGALSLGSGVLGSWVESTKRLG